ncbi:DUF7575 domain-containing protein [Halorubrum trueperi]|uniref:Zinc ribbon domain-containing protein n=1 Tax=Halorubrum trueperi TaxID=2004704 RepID=A0ABD5UE78_9EURY
MSDSSRRRPWLAAALALVVSGLGHAYLRRWARAFGWYVVITATLVFLVPDAAVEGLFAGDPPPLGEIAPAVLVVSASVVDAYVVAIRNNREHERRTAAVDDIRTGDRGEPSGNASRDEQKESGNHTVSSTASAARAERTSTTPTGDTCPHCGRETDSDLDFCKWCAEALDE